MITQRKRKGQTQTFKTYIFFLFILLMFYSTGAEGLPAQRH